MLRTEVMFSTFKFVRNLLRKGGLKNRGLKESFGGLVRTKTLPNGNIKTSGIRISRGYDKKPILSFETNVKTPKGDFVYNTAGDRAIVNGTGKTTSYAYYDKYWQELNSPLGDELASFHIPFID